jgi:hypothetical protein
MHQTNRGHLSCATGQHKASGDLAPARRTPRWVAPLYLVLAVCLLPWILYTAWSLPWRSPSSSWDLTWAEFDAGCLSRPQRPDGRPGGKPGLSRRARPLLGR